MKKFVCLFLAILLLGCSAKAPEEVKPEVEEPVVEDSIVSFMGVGDNLIHGAIYLDAYRKYGEYKFDDVYEEVADFVKSKDVAYINQETILGGTKLGLSHYPQFNSPHEIGDAIAKAGFDWVASSSNHSMDAYEEGIVETLKFWDQYPEIVTTGLARSEEERNSLKYIERNGVKIGVLGYTYGTNGIVVPEGKEYLVNVYSKEMIQEDVERIKDTCDVLMVSMHWGDEYSYEPSDEQKEMAQFLADLGVDVVIGEHPHVIQPMDWVEGKDGNETLVIYSLGNFLSAQDEMPRMLGGCVSFDIRKLGKTGEIKIENVKFYPTITHFTEGAINFKVYLLKDYTDELGHQHGLANQGTSRHNFIELTKEIMGDEFELVY